MDYRAKRKLEAHDAAGFETALDDFSEFDDAYGNCVSHGDKSMQRCVEAGIRDPQMFDSRMAGKAKSVAYDTEPFQSQAQRGYMYVHHPEIAKEFEAETPKGKKLPEHNR